jgi:hypothetical protein
MEARLADRHAQQLHSSSQAVMPSSLDLAHYFSTARLFVCSHGPLSHFHFFTLPHPSPCWPVGKQLHPIFLSHNTYTRFSPISLHKADLPQNDFPPSPPAQHIYALQETEALDDTRKRRTGEVDRNAVEMEPSPPPRSSRRSADPAPGIEPETVSRETAGANASFDGLPRCVSAIENGCCTAGLMLAQRAHRPQICDRCAKTCAHQIRIPLVPAPASPRASASPHAPHDAPNRARAHVRPHGPARAARPAGVRICPAGIRILPHTGARARLPAGVRLRRSLCTSASATKPVARAQVRFRLGAALHARS